MREETKKKIEATKEKIAQPQFSDQQLKGTAQIIKLLKEAEKVALNVSYRPLASSIQDLRQKVFKQYGGFSAR